MPDRPAGDFLASQGSRLKRRSYSGFVAMTKPEELSRHSLSNRA